MQQMRVDKVAQAFLWVARPYRRALYGVDMRIRGLRALLAAHARTAAAGMAIQL
jgi:hypothetical protein